MLGIVQYYAIGRFRIYQDSVENYHTKKLGKHSWNLFWRLRDLKKRTMKKFQEAPFWKYQPEANFIVGYIISDREGISNISKGFLL